MTIDKSFNHITNSTVTVMSQAQNTPVPKQLTTTLGTDINFIGRENELKTIDEKLVTSNSLLLINGIGGVGKSAIASHYLQCKYNELDYYGFFEGLDQFVTELRTPLALQQEKQNDAFIEALVKLRSLEGKKLLVIDNVKEIEEQEETLNKILALKEHGYHILLISREEIDEDKVASFYLDVLCIDDAKKLFNSIYPIDDADQSLLADILQNALDCHTLFVELTAKTLKDKKTITLQGLKEKFDSGKFSKIKIKKKKSFGRYLNQLFTIDQLDKDATQTLKQLSVFPSIEIPFNTLQRVFAPEDNEKFEEILNYLSEKGWLIKATDGYKLHQIIKEFMLAEHPPEFEKDVLSLVENINGLEEGDQYIISTIAAFVDRYLSQEPIQMFQLSASLASTYHYWALYNKAIPIAEKLVEIREKNLGNNHLDTATSYNNLAVLYKSQGEYAQALPLYKKALAISKKCLGGDHFDTATSYNNLAVLYKSQGKYDQALPLYKKTLAIRKKCLGDDHPDTAMSYNNLAGLYQSQGKYAQALPLYEKALVIGKKSVGDDYPNTAMSYNNLARLYQLQGKYAQALLLYQKALAIHEKNVGDHPDTATSYNNLAVLYESQDEYAQALPLYQKALAIREISLGIDHPDTAGSYNNLAVFHASKGEYAQALPLYKKALAIRKKSLGDEHPNTATSYNNLAELYKFQDDYAQALPLHKKALAIREKSLGNDHPDTAGSYNNLAVLYVSKDKYLQALPLLEKALVIYEKRLGEDHPYTIESYKSLAGLYQSQGKHSKALLMHEKLLAIKEKGVGEYDPDAIAYCRYIAINYSKLKNCKKAQHYATKALTIYTQLNDIKNKNKMQQLLKTIKCNIKKAKKSPLKRRHKYCKDKQC